MLHYLLYIIIQKGIPAMGCLDAVLEMRGNGGFMGEGLFWGGVLGEIAWGFAIRSFVYNVVLLLLYFLQGRVGHDGLQAKTEPSPGAGFTMRREPRLCCF